MWDLASNQTFMSRKHFAGKHKGGITCGAWGPRGETLALGSANQVKVSQPLQNASWDQTATKLHLPANADATGGFQQLLFSESGLMLAAFAGSSVFRHLCLYAVIDHGKKGSELTPVGEAHPSQSVGSIQAAIWLAGDVMLVVTSNGFVRFMRWDRMEGSLTEELIRACDSNVVGAVRLASGHIAIAQGARVLVWDPVTRAAAAVAELAPMPRNVRLMALEAAARPGASAVIVARSDGELSQIPLPPLPTVDTGLVLVSHSGGGASSVAKPLSVGTPHMLLHITPEEGALHRRLEPLHHAWSPEMEQLAIVNSNSQLLVFSAEDGRCVLRNPLPKAPCTFLQWDPSTGKTVALALRGSGVGIWTADTGADVKIWTGMQSSGGLLKLGGDSAPFDPMSACWSRAGQLAIGMSDGSFAVWDSVSSCVSTPGRSGKHKAAITAGDWIDSLFAPALALGSRDTIKISKGFETAGWEATAVKLKLGRTANGSGDGVTSPLSRLGSSSSGLIRKARVDPEGLEFMQLKFSAGGKYLAALAFPSMAPTATQVRRSYLLLLYNWIRLPRYQTLAASCSRSPGVSFTA
jgi:WD40 repeat protein